MSTIEPHDLPQILKYTVTTNKQEQSVRAQIVTLPPPRASTHGEAR